MIFPWQQTQWQQIDQLISTGRLPHAMFLHGNEGLGKTDFAVSMAASVLCKQPDENHHACGVCSSCHLLAASTHPDLHYLKPTAKKNSTSKKPALSIRIEEIRDLCEKLNQTSQFSGYRVAILEQADQMTLAAANSLLKTLEEPGKGVLMLLVSARAQRLPITIRSRCQSLRFTVPDEATALNWLKTDGLKGENYKDEQLQQSLRQAYGSPLAALQQLEEAEQYQLLAEAMTASLSGKNALDYPAKLIRYNKVKILEAMLNWVSDLSRIVACGPEASIVNEAHRSMLKIRSKKIDPLRLYRFQDQLNFNLRHSSIAVNEQLLWENLLLSWDNL
ncbi:MAG: DNA polymerase III subunit delta' [Proteobacteria bacterium]|nr:DNA polymerase III subunit delta' [Pseudomonadota bacterium]